MELTKETEIKRSPQFVRDEFTLVVYSILAAFSYEGAIFGPMMSFLREELHFGYALSSYHFAAWSLGSILAGFIGNQIAAKLGRKNTVWLFCLFVCLEVLFLVSANSVFCTIALALALGASGAIMGQSLFYMLSHRHSSLKVVAITESTTVSSLCSSLSPLALAFFSKTALGWRAAVVLPVIVFFAVFILKRKQLETSQGPEQKSETMKESASLPKKYWLCWTLVLLSVASEWSIIYWAADFLNSELKMPKADAAAAVSLFLFAMVLGRFSASRLARDLSATTLLKAASVLSVCGFLIFWLSNSAILAMSGLFICGMGIANFYPITFSLAIESAPGSAGIAIARMYLATGLSTLLLPVVLGTIADKTGIFEAFFLVAVLLVFCLAMVFLPKWQENPQSK